MKGQTNKVILENRLQRALRRNMTDAERLLWQHLRAKQMHGLKFRRQHPFGDFILDFVCIEKGLVIEIDGGQHAEQVERDERRSKALEAAGFRVLRFWNNRVIQETDSVMEVIWQALQSPPPSRPSP